MNNLGKLDRTIRIVLGVAIFGWLYGVHESYWGFLGVVLILSGLLNFCFLYKILGIKTN
jgi:hypothetical protein